MEYPLKSNNIHLAMQLMSGGGSWCWIVQKTPISTLPQSHKGKGHIMMGFKTWIEGIFSLQFLGRRLEELGHVHTAAFGHVQAGM